MPSHRRIILALATLAFLMLLCVEGKPSMGQVREAMLSDMYPVLFLGRGDDRCYAVPQ